MLIKTKSTEELSGCMCNRSTPGSCTAVIFLLPLDLTFYLVLHLPEWDLTLLLVLFVGVLPCMQYCSDGCRTGVYGHLGVTPDVSLVKGENMFYRSMPCSRVNNCAHQSGNLLGRDSGNSNSFLASRWSPCSLWDSSECDCFWGTKTLCLKNKTKQKTPVMLYR